MSLLKANDVLTATLKNGGEDLRVIDVSMMVLIRDLQERVAALEIAAKAAKESK